MDRAHRKVAATAYALAPVLSKEGYRSIVKILKNEFQGFGFQIAEKAGLLAGNLEIRFAGQQRIQFGGAYTIRRGGKAGRN